MIELRKEMIDAISQAVRASGSQLAFERKTGIRQSTINKILNRKSVSITDRTWRDLFPFAQPYLPEKSVVSEESRRVIGNSAFFKAVTGGDGTDMRVEEFRRRAINGIIDMEIDSVAKDVVLKFLKNLS